MAPVQSKPTQESSNEPNNKFKFLQPFKQDYMKMALLGLGLTVALGFFFRYKVASPSQYIVKTGLGINDLTIAKKTFVFPFQRYSFLDITPKNYTFNLHAMSNEKMELFGSFLFFSLGNSNFFVIVLFLECLLLDQKMILRS